LGDFEDEKPLVEKKEEGEHKIIEEIQAGIEVV
jgi:hypothetical protein